MGSRGRSKRAAGVPAPRFAAEPMLDAGHLGQLMRLRLRHLRTELAWWGYAFGTDLAERADLLERIYQMYLVLIAGGSALAAWAMLLARVEESFRLLGPVLVPLFSFLLIGAGRAVRGPRARGPALLAAQADGPRCGAYRIGRVRGLRARVDGRGGARARLGLGLGARGLHGGIGSGSGRYGVARGGRRGA
ncbi:MAG: hypothetical protein E7001_07600 [Coriobacteriaceae bacterium]|nr:hypothetical protein [Coriobacteriaceae bacterium]